MQFLQPQLGWLALLALAPIALYLFRRRSRTIDVSTMVFFKTLAREHQESEWLRRLKRWISLVLTLILLLGAVLALLQMVSNPVGSGIRNVVILMDRSASMGAVDGEGRSRMEEAKATVRARLRGLGANVGVSLVAYDGRKEVLEAPTLNRRLIHAALDGIEVVPVAAEVSGALETARMLAGLETPAEIWHVTDRAEEMPGEAQAGVGMRPVEVGLAEPVNVGFTAFQIRKLPLQSSRFTAFVQIAANEAAAGPLSGRIEARIGTAYLPPRSFEIEPGTVKGFEIPMEGAIRQLLQLSLHVEGDCLPLDNEILAPLPEARPVVAVRVGPKETVDPFTHLALQSLIDEGSLQIWSAQPEQWPLQDIDVAIFDNWLPQEWPAGVPVILMNPPRSLGPVRVRTLGGGGLPHPEIREISPDHPLLFRVSTSRLALTQTAVLQAAGSLEPLWMAGREPVLLAGEVEGQRIVVMGFSPQTSERLPLTASFPILVGNALYWCAGEEDSAGDLESGRRTGDVVESSGSKVRWKVLDGEKITERTEPVDRGIFVLQRTGVWETDAGERGMAHLLSRSETNVPVPARSAGEAAAGTHGFSNRADPTTTILVVLLVVLLVESLLFHRFAVY